MTPHQHQALIREQIQKSYSSNTQQLSDQEVAESANVYFEKGGKKAVIGEIRTFGGRQYIKAHDGWKFHGKGTGVKAQEHKAAATSHAGSSNPADDTRLSPAERDKAREKKEEKQSWSEHGVREVDGTKWMVDRTRNLIYADTNKDDGEHRLEIRGTLKDGYTLEVYALTKGKLIPKTLETYKAKSKDEAVEYLAKIGSKWAKSNDKSGKELKEKVDIASGGAARYEALIDREKKLKEEKNPKASAMVALGGMSADEAQLKYKDVYTIKNAGIKLTQVNKNRLLKMADEMSASALSKFVADKLTALNRDWPKLTYGSSLYYSEDGKKAKLDWNDTILQMREVLNAKTKHINVITPSKKKITFKNNTIFIDGKKVTNNRDAGHVHLEGKGNGPVELMVGAFYSGDAAMNQLQGITYNSAHYQLKEALLSGKNTWPEIDAKMSTTSGPIHGEKPGRVWGELKKYLGL